MKHMKFHEALVLFLLVLTASFQAQAQVIPANRAFFSAWRSAGYAGPIPSPAKIVNVRDFGAQATAGLRVVRTISSMARTPSRMVCNCRERTRCQTTRTT